MNLSTGVRPRLSRRQLLTAGCAAVATVAASGVLSLPSWFTSAPPMLAPGPIDFRVAVLEAIADPGDAVFIGRSFIEDLGELGEPQALEALVRERLGIGEGGASSAAGVRDLVRGRIDADLDAGDIVLLDGWLVSLTEAIVFAYLAATAESE